MIGRLESRSDIKALVNYLITSDRGKASRPGAELLENSTLATSCFDAKFNLDLALTAQNLIDHFETIAKRNDRVKNKLKHIIISFSPQDGFVSDEVKQDVAREVIKDLGYRNCPFIAVAHDRNDFEEDHPVIKHNRAEIAKFEAKKREDKYKDRYRDEARLHRISLKHDHDHIHILTSTIDYEGKAISDSFDYFKIRRALERLQLKHNLTPLPSAKSQLKITARNREYEFNRERQRKLNPQQRETMRSTLQTAIDLSAESASTLDEFAHKLLRDFNVRFKAYQTRKKRYRVKYQLQGYPEVSSRNLTDASFPKLVQKRKLQFQSNNLPNNIDEVALQSSRTDESRSPQEPKTELSL